MRKLLACCLPSLIILFSVWWSWLFVGTWRDVRSRPARVTLEPVVESLPEFEIDRPLPSRFRQFLNLLVGIPFFFVAVVIAAAAEALAVFIFWPMLVAAWLARRSGR